MGESGGRVDIEDRERILAVVHAACRQNDGDEVGAGISKERQRCRFGQKLVLKSQTGSTIDR